MVCLVDRNFQMSLNSLKAYWTVPLTMQTYTSDAYIAIEIRSDVGSMLLLYLLSIMATVKHKICILVRQHRKIGGTNRTVCFNLN